MELLLTVTMRQCSLLCKIVYFHYSLYYYEFTIHHLVFSLSYAYIYDICMSRKRQALGKTLGETRSKTLSSSQPTKYQPPFLSKSLISPQKSLPCIRKKLNLYQKIILIIFWSYLNEYQCLKYYLSKFLNLF